MEEELMNEAQARIRMSELCQASVTLCEQIETEGFDIGDDVKFMLKRWNNLCAAILIDNGSIAYFDSKTAIKNLLKEANKSLNHVATLDPDGKFLKRTTLEHVMLTISNDIKDLESK